MQNDIQMETVQRIYKAFEEHYRRSDISASFTFPGRHSSAIRMHLHVSGWPGADIPLCSVREDGTIWWSNDLNGFRIAITHAGSNPTRERWNQAQWLEFCKAAKGENQPLTGGGRSV